MTTKAEVLKFPPLSKEPRNKVGLPSLALVLDRFGVSDRAGAVIASATLADYGLIDQSDTNNIIDRSKVRRARKCNRETLQSQQNATNISNIKGLYFDGRKDQTLTIIDERQSKIMEEHIVLIEEPGSKYIGHVTPKSGSAVDIVTSIGDYFEKMKLKKNDLIVVGCDGTNTNTGNKGGIITIIENQLGRALQRFICQLHANELPLHLYLGS